MPRKQQGLTRREFLRYAGATAALVAGGGGVLALLRLLEDNRGGDLGSQEDTLKYYPELQGYPIRQQSVLETTDGTKIRIYNLSQNSINFQAANTTVTFFDSLAHLYPTYKNYAYVHEDGQSEPITIFLEPAQTRPNNVFFIVPQDAPSPQWAGQNFGKYATTTKRFLDSHVSFIRIVGKDSQFKENEFLETQNATNVMLDTELCNQLIWFKVASVSGVSADEANEIVCNSLARGVALRQMGYSYQDYLSYLQQFNGFAVSPTRPLQKIVGIDQPRWNVIPQTNPFGK